jgi:salicylate hydroxylase
MTAPFRTPVAGAAIAPFHVLVIGGGIGGLCLAQGLKRAGISVAVYERDRTPADRLQGYRVHISPAGSRALHACLPPHLFELFDRTCGKPGRAFHFMTEDMQVLLALEGELMVEQQRNAIAKHRAVSRITLRHILLSGLDDVVHLGKTFTRYEERGDGRIVAHFEDGSSAEGDILVAADGGGSRVRRQFLPQAERIDTGVIGIAGKVFLDDASRARLAPALLDGLTLVAAKGALGLFAAMQDFDGTALDGIGADEAFPGTGNLFDNTRSYLMWALSGKRARLGLDGGAEKLDTTALAATAARAMAGWAKGFRDLVDLSDPTTISCLPIRVAAGRAVADRAHHVDRRRHPFDDALPRHRRQYRAQGRRASARRTDRGAAQRGAAARRHRRLRDRNARLRLQGGAQLAAGDAADDRAGADCDGIVAHRVPPDRPPTTAQAPDGARHERGVICPWIDRRARGIIAAPGGGLGVAQKEPACDSILNGRNPPGWAESASCRRA